MDNLLERLDHFIKKEANNVSIKKITFVFLTSLVVIFFVVTVVILFYSPEEFEALLSRRLQAQRNPLLDTYMRGVSFLGDRKPAIIMISGSVALFTLFGYFKEASFMLLTSLGSIINYFLKILFNRPRPTDDLVEVMVIAQNQSFPSGHTVHFVVYFGMLMIIVFRLKRLNAWFRTVVMFCCLVLIFSIPFSRVYLGAHWLTDVMAGMVVGILLLSLLLFFYLKRSEMMLKR